MKIKVTQQHINDGEQSQCSICPVALAIKAAASITRVNVYPSFVSYLTNEYYLKDLPDHVGGRILHFDETGQMSPFEFELDI